MLWLEPDGVLVVGELGCVTGGADVVEDWEAEEVFDADEHPLSRQATAAAASSGPVHVNRRPAHVNRRPARRRSQPAPFRAELPPVGTVSVLTCTRRCHQSGGPRRGGGRLISGLAAPGLAAPGLAAPDLARPDLARPHLPAPPASPSASDVDPDPGRGRHSYHQRGHARPGSDQRPLEGQGGHPDH